MMLRVKGVKLALFLTEYDGFCKLSIRARAPYGAREIAAAFGGGGHPCAAGAKVPGTITSAVESVKEEALRFASLRNIACK